MKFWRRSIGGKIPQISTNIRRLRTLFRPTPATAEETKDKEEKAKMTTEQVDEHPES
ncbi:hypothetical protein C1H46_002014 [Malus baccata]|uniref:Uncharacterized protein n=1 Tax=Malus baccata TaxID=106549 RepID=A0A540NMW1_MALBA|nr:hypothetical protein C1H46_002014 [Malus baccata]